MSSYLDQVVEAVVAFLTTKNWNDTFAELERRRRYLLTDEAEAVLAALRDEARKQPNNSQAAGYLDLHREIIHVARAVGIPAARGQFEAALQQAQRGAVGQQIGAQAAQAAANYRRSYAPPAARTLASPAPAARTPAVPSPARTPAVPLPARTPARTPATPNRVATAVAVASPGNSLARTSLTLGLLGLVCGVVTGLPAVITGHLALDRATRDPGLGGRGAALAGLMLGYFDILLTAAIVILVFRR